MRNRPGLDFGFTLTELLITLGILGAIAAFTIPKVLQFQQSQAWNQAAKDAMSGLTVAYQRFQNQQNVTVNTKSSDLTPYINYIYVDSTAHLIDQVPGQTSLDCSVSGPCLHLQNGGVLMQGGVNFGVLADNYFIHYLFDPDGQYSGSTNGPGKSIAFDIYYNGKVKTGVQRQPGDHTYQGGVQQNWGADTAPDWFTPW